MTQAPAVDTLQKDTAACDALVGRPAGFPTILSPAHQHIVVSVQKQALVGGLPPGGSQGQVVEGPALAVVAQALLLVQGHAHEPGQYGSVWSGRCRGMLGSSGIALGHAHACGPYPSVELDQPSRW